MAGTIDSRKGRATTAPAPLRKVRLGNDFFVTNISGSSLLRAFLAKLDAHAKRRTFDDTQHDGRKSVIARFRVLDYLTHDRHVVVAQAPAEGVGQQLLGERPDEHAGVAREALPQIRDPFDRRAVR